MKKLKNKVHLKIIIILLSTIGLVSGLVLFLGRDKYLNNSNNYEIQIKKIDDFSPDRELVVLNDGREVKYKLIKYLSDVILCYSENPIISFSEIDGIEELIVVLEDNNEIIVKIRK